MQKTLETLWRGIPGQALCALALSALLATPGAAVTGEHRPPELIFAGGDFRSLMSTELGEEGIAATTSPQLRVDFAPNQPAALAALAEPSRHHDNLIVIRDTAPSPDGRWIAVQVDLGTRPMTWLIEAADRDGESLRPLVPKGIGFFLGWHPDGEEVLFRALDLDVPDPGLWLVRVADGSHRRIEIPELEVPMGLTAASVSPDGELLAYAFTRGLGSGSEIWLSDPDGGARQRVHQEANGVVGSLRWSHDSGQLAFNTLFDSPVPFAEAGLWVFDRERGEARWLGLMDGGHGEEPVWSDDGTRLFFVARENADDPAADRDPAALVSSIRAIDLATGRESVLLDAAASRQIDLTRGLDGQLLFISNRDGAALEAWSLDPAAGRAVQLTNDGLAKRHPLLSDASRR